jgi:hypothetical protein
VSQVRRALSSFAIQTRKISSNVAAGVESSSLIVTMSDIEHEDPFSFRSLAELPRQTDPANAHIRPEVFLQWTFVAEIVAVTASEHYHTSLVVRDGDEQVLSVGFDLNDNDNNRLDELVRTTFKTGCTLLILDAHKVEIRCGRNVTGIVVNDIGHIKISSSRLFLCFRLAGQERC